MSYDYIRTYPPGYLDRHRRVLTRRERLRKRLSAIRWAVHNRLFPDCYRD